MERVWSDHQNLMHQMQAQRWVQAGWVRDKPARTAQREIEVRQQADERLDQAGSFGCVDLHALPADKRADAAALAAVALVRIGVARFFIYRLVCDGLLEVRTVVIGMFPVATSALGVTRRRLPGCLRFGRMSTILVMRVVPAASKQSMDGQQTSHEWRNEANHFGKRCNQTVKMTRRATASIILFLAGWVKLSSRPKRVKNGQNTSLTRPKPGAVLVLPDIRT